MGCMWQDRAIHRHRNCDSGLDILELSWQQTEIKQQKPRAHCGLNFPAFLWSVSGPAVYTWLSLQTLQSCGLAIGGCWADTCQNGLQRMELVLRNWKLRAGWKNLLIMGLGSLEFDCKALGTHLGCGILPFYFPKYDKIIVPHSIGKIEMDPCGFWDGLFKEHFLSRGRKFGD